MLPPKISNLTFISLLKDYYRDPLKLFLHLSKTYDEVVCLNVGKRTFVAGLGPKIHDYVLLQNPDKFKRFHRKYTSYLYPNDLERLDGDLHLEKRKQFTKMYAKPYLYSLENQFHEKVDRAVSLWYPGYSIDLVEEVLRIVESIFIISVVGVDIDDRPVEVHKALRKIRNHLSTPSALIFDFVPSWFPFSTLSRLKDDLREFEKLLSEIREDRKYNNLPGLPSFEYRRNHGVVTLPGAIGVVTASIVWLVYLIVQHPNVNRKLTTEIDGVLGKQGFYFEDLDKLKYLKLIVKEGLRLYSNVGIISRVSTKPFEIDGYEFPPNSYIGLIPYVLHRDIRIYDKPNLFLPERFLKSEKGKTSIVYLPFGLGPHNCIGRNLALLSIKYIIVSIWQHYRLELCSGQSLYERQLATQEINLHMHFRVLQQDNKVELSPRRVTGDAIGALPGPSWGN